MCQDTLATSPVELLNDTNQHIFCTCTKGGQFESERIEIVNCVAHRNLTRAYVRTILNIRIEITHMYMDVLLTVIGAITLSKSIKHLTQCMIYKFYAVVTVR